MARAITLTTMVLVIVLLFHFAGLIEPEESLTGSLLKLTQGPTNFTETSKGTLFKSSVDTPTSSNNWFALLGISVIALIGIIGAAVIFGGDIVSILYLVLIFGLLGVMVPIGWDILLIFQYLYAIHPMMGIMFGSPLIIMWGFSVYDWIRGRG